MAAKPSRSIEVYSDNISRELFERYGNRPVIILDIYGDNRKECSYWTGLYTEGEVKEKNDHEMFCIELSGLKTSGITLPPLKFDFNRWKLYKPDFLDYEDLAMLKNPMSTDLGIPVDGRVCNIEIITDIRKAERTLIEISKDKLKGRKPPKKWKKDSRSFAIGLQEAKNFFYAWSKRPL